MSDNLENTAVTGHDEKPSDQASKLLVWISIVSIVVIMGMVAHSCSAQKEAHAEEGLIIEDQEKALRVIKEKEAALPQNTKSNLKAFEAKVGEQSKQASAIAAVSDPKVATDAQNALLALPNLAPNSAVAAPVPNPQEQLALAMEGLRSRHATGSMAGAPGIPGAPAKKTAYEQYLEAEQKRAYASRAAEVSFGSSSVPAKATPSSSGFDLRQPPKTQGSGMPNVPSQDARFQQVIKQREQLQTLTDSLNGLTASAGGTGDQAPPASRYSFPSQAQKPPMNNIVGEPVENRTAKQEGPKAGEVLLKAGDLATCKLDFVVSSDFIGAPWRCLLDQDILDVTRTFVIAPKGSRAKGRVLAPPSINQAIRNTVGFTAEEIILPDGSRIDLTKLAYSNVLDQSGYAGLSGDTSYHLLPQLAGVAAYAVIGLGPSMMLPDNPNPSARDDAYAQMAQGVSQQFQPLAQKYLSLVPTTIPPIGSPMKIFFKDDLYVKPWRRLSEVVYAQ